MDQRVTIAVSDGVADVRLNRPAKMNALDHAMFEALRDAGEALKSDTAIRAAVLSGEGRAFCAGLDTGNFGDMAQGGRTGDRLLGGTRTQRGANPAQQAVMVWREVPVPVIAAVHGVAFGGGFQLMLGADMRIVAPDARLSIMEIKWGLVPDMAGIALLRGLVRDDVARDLTYTGRIISGEEAATLGLATHIAADPHADAMSRARAIAANSPNSLRAAKRLFELALDANEAAILHAESVEQAALIGSPNQREAILAALDKRAAVYRDAT